jgi:histidinol-phosphate/aromatic aminotransferase/cobyric acid decarboxylase-like protein
MLSFYAYASQYLENFNFLILKFHIFECQKRRKTAGRAYVIITGTHGRTSTYIDPSCFMVGAGSGAILSMLAFALGDPGDGVLIPSPSYPGYGIFILVYF